MPSRNPGSARYVVEIRDAAGASRFLGIGAKYHPLPWSTLKYDESKGGYPTAGEQQFNHHNPDNCSLPL